MPSCLIDSTSSNNSNIIYKEQAFYIDIVKLWASELILLEVTIETVQFAVLIMAILTGIRISRAQILYEFTVWDLSFSRHKHITLQHAQPLPATTGKKEKKSENAVFY